MTGGALEEPARQLLASGVGETQPPDWPRHRTLLKACRVRTNQPPRLYAKRYAHMSRAAFTLAVGTELLRISYAASLDQIDAALARFRRFIAGLGGG